MLEVEMKCAVADVAPLERRLSAWGARGPAGGGPRRAAGGRGRAGADRLGTPFVPGTAAGQAGRGGVVTPLVVQTVEDVRRAVAAARGRGATVGLVPPMGALHEGHL